jgi:hypothetical protein
MTFLELYGNALDVELGTEDRAERFTVGRRKTAINNAQREWVRLTGSFTQEGQVDLSDGIREYDLEAILDSASFLRFSEQQPYMQIIDADGVTSTYEGPNFERMDVPRLDLEQTGWRSTADGTPSKWYMREDQGRVYFGVNILPDPGVGESWYVKIPYVSYAADMVADADEPFAITAGGNPKKTLRAYHQALVHYAAYELEKLRKNYQVGKMQKDLFMEYVQEYLTRLGPTGPQRVGFAHNYMAAAMQHNPEASDPRR